MVKDEDMRAAAKIRARIADLDAAGRYEAAGNLEGSLHDSITLMLHGYPEGVRGEVAQALLNA